MCSRKRGEHQMTTTYGTKRVLEPQYVLPTSAWKLDNSRDIYTDEMRVSIKRIHLEGTSFKQICTETNNNEQKIRQKIIDITIRRGKLHNPVTDTLLIFTLSITSSSFLVSTSLTSAKSFRHFPRKPNSGPSSSTSSATPRLKSPPLSTFRPTISSPPAEVASPCSCTSAL